jgi:hypothetical protein
MGGNKIENLANATANGDAVNYAQLNNIRTHSPYRFKTTLICDSTEHNLTIGDGYNVIISGYSETEISGNTILENKGHPTVVPTTHSTYIDLSAASPSIKLGIYVSNNQLSYKCAPNYAYRLYGHR